MYFAYISVYCISVYGIFQVMLEPLQYVSVTICCSFSFNFITIISIVFQPSRTSSMDASILQSGPLVQHTYYILLL